MFGSILEEADTLNADWSPIFENLYSLECMCGGDDHFAWKRTVSQRHVEGYVPLEGMIASTRDLLKSTHFLLEPLNLDLLFVLSLDLPSWEALANLRQEIGSQQSRQLVVQNEMSYDSLPPLLPPPSPTMPQAPPYLLHVASLLAKFGMPDIERYKGVGCPRIHLRLYITMMRAMDVLRRELEALRQRSNESISPFISRWQGKMIEIVDRPSERDQIQMMLSWDESESEPIVADGIYEVDVDEVHTPDVDDVHTLDIQYVIREGFKPYMSFIHFNWLLRPPSPYVLLDNGSTLNVCPLTIAIVLDYVPSDFGPSTQTVRAYDSTRKEVMCTLEIELLMGPTTFSTMFQKVKFIHDGQVVTVQSIRDMFAFSKLVLQISHSEDDLFFTGFTLDEERVRARLTHTLFDYLVRPYSISLANYFVRAPELQMHSDEIIDGFSIV
ncbi:hypothetical protein CK203_109509 [Vitis vinifera]|uniref:Uncharacterized protein n=1 Tax=Vitis vinifera TaxID=29760 RepID=A0A438EAK7_VITVI|nr:hypothetical protein CK203_109509 [Vitis vinifera]